MATGEYGVSDVPLKAIQAEEIIYQASSLLSVTAPVIPEQLVQATRVEFDVTKGVVGEDQVDFDADAKHEKLAYTSLNVNLTWSMYPYMINDKAKLQSRDPNTLWEDAAASASEFFATIRDYRTITALSAGNVNTHAAGANWDASGADPEYDITTAINSIRSDSNWRPGESVTVIVPADVEGSLDQLNLIKNVQQTMRDYLEGSYARVASLQIVGYRPYLEYNTGTKLFDALGSDALVVVNGRNTARFFKFDPAEAARRDVPLVEHSRIHGRGDYYTQKMGTGCRVVWDALQSTNTKTTRCYKITGVT